MPLCKECESHFLKYHLEIAGVKKDTAEELPSFYRNTPTCPVCGLIGDIKKSKLRDALVHIKSACDDPLVVADFMAFYRKRGKDFKDPHSVALAFLGEGD